MSKYKGWTWKAEFSGNWSSQGYANQQHINIMNPYSVTVEDLIQYVTAKGKGRKLINIEIKEEN